MQLHRGRLPAELLKHRTVVTVGTFDGVHVGHIAILELLKQVAREDGMTPLVATFDPHPRSIVSGEPRAISLLYSFEERVQLLEANGIEHVFVIEFDESTRQLSPRGFVEEFALRRWNAGHIIAGFNHSFGKDRSGDRESLIAMGKELGLGVDIAAPVIVADQTVSSTMIRKLLLEGDIPIANRMLGRKFALTGRVIKGYGRGRRMGCPTANLNGFPSNKMVPRDGIYAAIAEIGEYAYPAALSIGFNPTFGNQRHSVEAHVIDFDGDLYDRNVTVRFIKRLRGEIKFSGEETLANQMQQDIAEIRLILQDEGFDLAPRQIGSQQDVIN